MNDFSNIPSEGDLRETATVHSDEYDPRNPAYDSPDGIFADMSETEEESFITGEGHRFYDEPNNGWPGDGSGEDDLADYNQNEADDYRDEGEMDTPIAEQFDGDGDFNGDE